MPHKYEFVGSSPAPAITCPHGDPLCPCQDGLLCHYEGKDPLPCKHCEEVLLSVARL